MYPYGINKETRCKLCETVKVANPSILSRKMMRWAFTNFPGKSYPQRAFFIS